MDHQLSSRKRVCDNSIKLEINSPEVKRLREDLLNDSYDSDYICTPSYDLDSFMKSFEDEITASPLMETAGVSSDSGESQPELGYLLEASDDELGLPPPTEAETESVPVCSTESAEFSSEFWGLDDQISSNDSFDLGNVESGHYSGNMGEYVGLDGLFDHSDFYFGSGDFLWRPETLPAQ